MLLGTVVEQLNQFKAFFGEGPVATVAALELYAIIALAVLCVRSFNARLKAAADSARVGEKMLALHERTLEVLEDDQALRAIREKRKSQALNRPIPKEE